MAHPGRARSHAAATALAIGIGVVPAGAARAQSPTPAATAAPAPGIVDQGRRMFEGLVPFQNGGPPCAACHTIATVAFPNGGTVGPDLSGIYDRLGPEGTAATLQTLFFPTMQPLYQQRQLVPEEQAALAAFLAQAKGVSGRDRDTVVLAVAAAVGSLLLLLITWLATRGSLYGVRAPLVGRLYGRTRSATGGRAGGGGRP